VSKPGSIKIEDNEHDNESSVNEEISHSTAIRSLIILAVFTIIGLLIIFGIEKYSSSNALKQIRNYMVQAEIILKSNRPQNAFIIENLELDLTRLRADNVDNEALAEEINKILRRIQDVPVYARTGTQIRSWATSEIVRTELDSIIVQYRDRNKYTLKTIFQPASTIESKAFELQKSHPDWTRDECMRIINRKLWAGMTKVQLQAAWGQPRTIDKNYTFGINSEQWVYGTMGPYVYLENGVITSWQE
jgi:hypothetical protein